MAKADTVKEKQSTNGSSEWVEVGNSKIHQSGLFAKKDIPKGTRMIPYLGEKITKAESHRRGVLQDKRGRSRGDATVYIFHLNTRYDIDGDVPGNDAKYINHSCDPNTVSDIQDHEIWLIALRDIKKGEEIVYDYKFEVAYYKKYPCRCGTKKCLGYMVGAQYRTELKKILKAKEKKKKKDRIRMGQVKGKGRK